mgnify:CR=1 FL=1|jgi:hypothetical protein|nr:hypothetical protein [Odoribacter splanchnicus]
MKKIVFVIIISFVAFTMSQVSFSKRTEIVFELKNIEALAEAESTLPSECYDKYEAYASALHPKLEKFRPCDNSECIHIWAYHPRKKTICPN